MSLKAVDEDFVELSGLPPYTQEVDDDDPRSASAEIGSTDVSPSAADEQDSESAPAGDEDEEEYDEQEDEEDDDVEEGEIVPADDDDDDEEEEEDEEALPVQKAKKRPGRKPKSKYHSWTVDEMKAVIMSELGEFRGISRMRKKYLMSLCEFVEEYQEEKNKKRRQPVFEQKRDKKKRKNS